MRQAEHNAEEYHEGLRKEDVKELDEENGDYPDEYPEDYQEAQSARDALDALDA